MRISILTLFPDYFSGILNSSILKRAKEQINVIYEVINIRDFATDVHSTTDDRPYGGGPGMVLKIEPIFRSLRSLDLLDETIIADLESNTDKNHVFAGSAMLKNLRKKNDNAFVLLTSAKGDIFTQQKAREFAQHNHVVIICGHYEGVDERVSQYLVDAEISVGEYVLTGGEPAAAVIVDALVRLQPDVLGNNSSLLGESHDKPGTLGYPQYTRPEHFLGMSVPDILLSGNHASIKKWREKNRQKRNS
jgi:tRNA (guanine37-N1)-methyltransferase